MKLTFNKKIIAGFIGCACVLLTAAVISFKNGDKFVTTSQWVNHTHEVINELERTLTLSVEAESGMRGFLITGAEHFLQPYESSKAAIAGHFDKLRDLTKDNPAQQKNIDTLEILSKSSIAFLNTCIEARKPESADSAYALVKTGRGKYLLDEIRRTVAKCKNMEQELLVQRKEESEKDASDFNIVFAMLLITIVIVLIVIYFIINNNLKALRASERIAADQNWTLTGNGELIRNMQGNKELGPLLQIIIHQLATYLNAQIGAIYVAEENTVYLRLAGGYAIDARKKEKLVIKKGEGVVGQAAAENRTILLEDIPADYFNVNSGLGEIIPRHIILVPFAFENEVKGVIELGSISEFTELHKQYLEQVKDNIAIAVISSQAREKSKELLEETQRQAEELETQQEELRQTNDELLTKSESLEQSELELRAQQEELKQNNEELEEKTNLLEKQKEELEIAKAELEDKARELEVTGKYKSEFLANMSHELRTPLNSVLILAQLLSENKNKTLGAKEVEFAKNIYNSGTDLLNLINEILDLSKIESGKMELEIAEVQFSEIRDGINSLFSEVARSRSVDFEIHIDRQLAKSGIITDRQRLEQILKNLLSNAFKFTGKDGKVTLSIEKAPASVSYKNDKLNITADVLKFSVSDTGIGIPQDKLEIIFEAFQQADGSTKRKYGGTGLGLSISRELAGALGGEIHLASEEGKGSTFTLYLPSKFDARLIDQAATGKQLEISRKELPKPSQKVRKEIVEVTEADPADAIDDRYRIQENDKIILIVEDDVEFSKVILDFVRDRNYKGIIAHQGRNGINYARHYKPDAIILDVEMPVIDGLEVLKQLKHDPHLRHIPVQIISGHNYRQKGMALGAFDYVEKPITTKALQRVLDKIEGFVSRKVKKLLIVEDNEQQNQVIRELIGDNDVKCFSAYSGSEAYTMLNNDWFDCMIVDLGLPDMSGFDLLEQIKLNPGLNRIPVVVYTGRDLTKEENARLSKLSSTVVLKTADSKERLLDETILFLHRVESKLPKEKQNMIRQLHKTEEVLKDKTILLVDDDIRNIYSLTNALEEEDVNCVIAENGKAALDILKSEQQVDLVLMDIMMPEMDGYEATREIRKMKKYDRLPIIALTAKAMKGDKEKCLAVGMSDYIAKPVNVEQLLSLMRVWLYR